MSEILEIAVTREINTPPELLYPVCDAIEALSDHIKGVRLGRVGDTYSFAKPIEQINLRKLHFRKRFGDITLVVTNQPLGIVDKTATAGIAWTRSSEYPLSDRHALLSYSNPELVKTTAIHETGHLIRGDQEGDWHCNDDGCTMYPKYTEVLERHIQETGDPVCFCESCQSTTNTNVAMLGQVKQNWLEGIPSPRHLRDD